ncbi:MAG: methylaspartate mutase, partial [Candidatus Hydrothermia bacterium]
LGTSIAPAGRAKEGKKCMRVTLYWPEGKEEVMEINGGQLIRIPLEVGKKVKALIEPAPGFDAGEGKGKRVETTVEGGVVGLILDARGRPLVLPHDPGLRVKKLSEWVAALDIYPAKEYGELLARNT